ncbi:MAG: hypothetical protein JOZ37_08590 [Actinobacteria bacterium]|nr:hypothetical protein [Actinomycetota bacterium]MBV9664010.1 hypothetical protein [Actinomycetota bacterium]MBV9934641.1 hypothetical protein [Actinomycetota bacterium]
MLDAACLAARRAARRAARPSAGVAPAPNAGSPLAVAQHEPTRTFK